MDKVNGRDELAGVEEDGSRYDSVVPPRKRPHGESGHDAGGGCGGQPGANSPDPGGRPRLNEENTGFEFGFLAVDTGAEPREEAANYRRLQLAAGRGGCWLANLRSIVCRPHHVLRCWAPTDGPGVWKRSH